MRELVQKFQDTSHHGFIVVDSSNKIYDVISPSDLELSKESKNTQVSVSDICTRQVVTEFPDDTLEDALQHLWAIEVGRIPDFDSHQPRSGRASVQRYCGCLLQGMIYKRKHDHHPARLQLEAVAGTELIRVNLNASDAVVGR